jgi:hypothetical protein
VTFGQGGWGGGGAGGDIYIGAPGVALGGVGLVTDGGFGSGTAPGDGGSGAGGRVRIVSDGGCCGIAGGVTVGGGSSVELFLPYSGTFTVYKRGDGEGTVTGLGGTIDCGADCTERFGPTISGRLAAAPAPGSEFAGWAGACAGQGACDFSANLSLGGAGATARFVETEKPKKKCKKRRKGRSRIALAAKKSKKKRCKKRGKSK